MAHLIHPSGASSLDITSNGTVKPRRPVLCKTCQALITDMDFLLSRSFNGFAGKAALFGFTSHVTLSAPTTRLMYTGAHTIQELSCARCCAYLGWKILRAHEWSEKWKEGRFLLELEALSGHEMWDEEAERRKRHRRRRTTITANAQGGSRRSMVRLPAPDSDEGTPSP